MPNGKAPKGKLLRLAAGLSGAVIGAFVSCVVADLIVLLMDLINKFWGKAILPIPQSDWAFFAVVSIGIIVGMGVAAKLTTPLASLDD
ncbi:MAG: hypothetical protein CMJ78_03770 [Planctomycetaceae bacterium]|nr:hypothetical protein [Planctomycetaceae bacterium]